MKLCNNSNPTVLQETWKNTLLTKCLASGYLVSLFGLGNLKILCSELVTQANFCVSLLTKWKPGS